MTAMTCLCLPGLDFFSGEEVYGSRVNIIQGAHLGTAQHNLAVVLVEHVSAEPQDNVTARYTEPSQQEQDRTDPMFM